MNTRSVLVPTLLASIAWFGACAGPLPPGEDGVTAVQFQDMVVPAGLRLIDDSHQSHSIEAASWRHGRFVYSGTVRLADAADYVRERMPQHNWTLVEDAVSGGQPDSVTTTLRYQRGYYATEYTFSRAEGRTHLVVRYETDYTRR